MPLYLNRLSPWEIGHRWHDIDPHQSRHPDDIPLVVKDTLRWLAGEIYAERLYSDLYLEREERAAESTLFRKKKIKMAISDYNKEFTNCITNGEIDPAFLKAVRVPIWEMEYWCEEYQIDFPAFWVRRPADEGGPSDSHHPDKLSSKATPVEPEISAPVAASPTDEPKHLQQRQAAHQRHEPLYQLKRDAVRLYLQTEKRFSIAETARRFLKIHKGEWEDTLKPSNAEKTIAKAISSYMNGKQEPWLEGFEP